MVHFKIAIRFLQKSLILSIIIMLQLSITIILVNFLLGKYNVLSEVLKITDRFSGYDTYMYMSNVSEGVSRSDKLEKILDKYKSDITFEQSITGQYIAENGVEYELYALGNTIATTLDSPVISGRWFTDAECTYIPCVTYPDHKLGDIITINMDGQTIEFQVVGTINRNANIFKFYISSNMPSLEYMFERNGESSPYSLIMFNQDDFPYEMDIIADSNALVFF